MTVPQQGAPAPTAPAGNVAASSDPDVSASEAAPAPVAPAVVPSRVKLLRSPAALALADLAALFEDLQTSLTCCERLVQELAAAEPDELTLESFWTTAVLSYARCFAPGPRGTGLTKDDVTATKLAGDVLGWHDALMQMRDRLVDPGVNPRESFSVGASQDTTGHAEGIAVASTRQPVVDEVSVRQTGAIAYALAGLVDGRLSAQQSVVFTAVGAMARPALDKLPVLHLEAPGADPTQG
jgi:hypothetical protein